MKRKITKRSLFMIISAVLICSFMLFTGCQKNPGEQPTQISVTPVYLAASQSTVPVYRYEKSTNENNEEVLTFEKADDMARGIKVYSREETVDLGTEEAPDEYLMVQLTDSPDTSDSDIYYVKPENTSSSIEGTVLETSRFVRTSVTIYQNENGAEIAGFAKKGSELEVTGFDSLNARGHVNKYKVKVPDTGEEGWVYAKYLTDSKESADAVYSSVAEIHKDRIYTDLDLHGGLPSNLDWYPFERTSIDGNELCTEAKTIYLCAEAAVNNSGYLQLIKEHGINAVVIDIKDGQLAYESEVAKELSPTSYNKAFTTVSDYQAAVKAFNDAGVYTIGRIVCFNDEYYAADHPETCIDSPESTRDWPSAYSRDAWYYNVSLAIEAVDLMGFDEIQFDYVRFPENAYSMSEDPATDYKNSYDEDKAEAIQNFCFYATDTIHEAGAYFSVDVFGECADEYVSAYGQYWPAISNIVDAISGMPYTDHYGADVDRWTYPYEIVYTFAERAANRQKEIDTPAVVRTWVTGYDTPNWDPTVDYNEEKMTDQINALYDAGLTGGFIPWNGGSNIYKYQEYAGIWDKTYSADPERSADFARKTEEKETEETTKADENSAEETTAEPVYEEPVYEEPVYEEPVYEEPVYEEPVYEEPIYEEPENY